MSDHVFSTKPGAADGLELGKPLGGGSSLTGTSDLNSSGGTTGLTGGSQGLTGGSHDLTGSHGSHGLTGGSSDPARNVADTPAGVAAGLGAGHHNQGGIHAPGSGAGGLTSGSTTGTGLSGTTDRLAQATATSGNTHTGAIGGNPLSRNDNLTDYNDKNIVTPNIGSGQTSSHGHGATGAALGAGAAGAGAAGLASRGTHDHSHDSTTTGKHGFNTAPVVGSGTTGHNHLHTGAALEGLTGKPSGHRVEPAELQREDRLGTAADHGAAGRRLSGTGVHDDGVPAADRHGALHGAGVGSGAHNTTAGDRGLTGTGHGGPTAYESDASRVGGHGHGAAAGAGLGAGALAAGGAAAAGHHGSSTGTGVTPSTHGYGSATQGSGVGHGVVGTAGGADATDANRGTGLTGRGGAAGAAAGLAGAGAATGLSGGNASNSVDALKQELKEHQSGSSHGTHPESQGPHGLVWHNGKYVHQREIDQHGSTGVPLANAFKDPKSGGEHGVNTDTNANNTRV